MKNVIQICLIMIGLSVSLPSLAHSVLKASIPSADTTVMTATQSIQLSFNNPITLMKVSVSAGATEIAIDFQRSATAQTEFTIATPALAPARYLVQWKGMGQDGHVMKGEFHFMQQ